MITPTTISEQSLFSTVRIEVKMKDGGYGTGTGFFFQYQFKKDHYLRLIVTNKHVVADAKSGEFFLHREEKKDNRSVPSGQFFGIEFDNFEDAWIGHPNKNIDLCAMLFNQLDKQIKDWGESPYVAYFDEKLIWTDEQLAMLSAVEEVVMVGYPIGLWDARNNLPIIRRGTTATHPGIDFQGRSEGVVDIAVFPGSSGSPVLLLNESGVYSDKKRGSVVVGTKAVFLGVLYAGPIWTSEGEVIVQEIPTAKQVLTQVPAMVNLGYMIKAKEIIVLAKHIIEQLEKKSPK
jgi:hypothetical protein